MLARPIASQITRLNFSDYNHFDTRPARLNVIHIHARNVVIFLWRTPQKVTITATHTAAHVVESVTFKILSELTQP